MEKKFLFALAIFMNVILFSCHEKSVEVTATKIIKNASEVDLSIEVFDQGRVVESISIDRSKADTTVAQCYTDDYGGLAGATCSQFSWHAEDSLWVTFSDSKRLRYCANFITDECNVNGKNILILQRGGYEFQSKWTYIFEITEDDYDAAIQIE